jgi:division protein CdvB (Snf7/Vps24/ESCRT-III family)
MEFFMTNAAFNTKPATPVETKQIILKEIGAKWGRFTEQDLSALKGKDDLVNQVASKYSLDKAQAQRDFDALMKGRSL